MFTCKQRSKIEKSSHHQYNTRHNRKKMEQAQASIEEMKAQMAAQMEKQTNRFMEVLANVTKGQEDLRALVEKTREEQRRGGLLSENYSAGQFLHDLVDNPEDEAHVTPHPPPQPNFITRNSPHEHINHFFLEH